MQAEENPGPVQEDLTLKQMINSFECPIQLTLMQEPMIASDGHSYEKTAIERWFKEGNTTSPFSGALLKDTTLIPNHALRNAIGEFMTGIKAIIGRIKKLEEEGLIREEMVRSLELAMQLRENDITALRTQTHVGTSKELPSPPGTLPVAKGAPAEDSLKLTLKRVDEAQIAAFFKISFANLEKAAGFIKEDKESVLAILSTIKTEMGLVVSYYEKPDIQLYYGEILKKLEYLGRLINKIPDLEGFHRSIKNILNKSISPLILEIQKKLLQSSPEEKSALQARKTPTQKLQAPTVNGVEAQENKRTQTPTTSPLVSFSLLTETSKKQSTLPDRPLVIHTEATTIETEISGDVAGNVDTTCFSVTGIPVNASLESIREAMNSRGPVRSITRVPGNVGGTIRAGILRISFANANTPPQSNPEKESTFTP